MREDGNRARRVEVRITGRVQGVCFRAEMRRAARSLGVAGFVRNLPDGSVHVVADGTEDDLGKLVGFCRKGPAGAIVHDVQFTWQEPTGSFDGFEITH